MSAFYTTQCTPLWHIYGVSLEQLASEMLCHNSEIIIHRHQFYRITLYLSWTTNEPITSQSQWSTGAYSNSSVIQLLLYDVIT